MKRTKEQKKDYAKKLKKRLAQHGFDDCDKCKKQAEDHVKHIETEEGSV